MHLRDAEAAGDSAVGALMHLRNAEAAGDSAVGAHMHLRDVEAAGDSAVGALLHLRDAEAARRPTVGALLHLRDAGSGPPPDRRCISAPTYRRNSPPPAISKRPHRISDAVFISSLGQGLYFNYPLVLLDVYVFLL